MIMPQLRDLVALHEGRKKKAYKDSRGILTIGIGYNLEQSGARTVIEGMGIDYDKLCKKQIELTDLQIEVLFKATINSAIYNARRIFPNLLLFPDDVQHVIIDMVFQLGYTGFGKFKNLIKALNVKDYAWAIDEIKYSDGKKKKKFSDLYIQTPNRVKSNIMLLQKHVVH